jgi:aspartate-semialdehyde dehydrogenase
VTASTGLRIGVLGATGALGSEVLAALDRSAIRVGEVRLFASDASLGDDIEFQGAIAPVETGPLRLEGLDLLFLCAPPGVSLEGARAALRAEVPAVDCSGALALSEEVPLRIAAFGAGGAQSAPLVAAPTGAVLALAPVLRAFAEAAGLRRAVATVLESASSGGKLGIHTLYVESLALFNQEEPPEPEIFGRPIAFDCAPSRGSAAEEGDSRGDRALVAQLGRLLGADAPLVISRVQVPAFVGLGASLVVETERPLGVADAAAVLEKAPAVEVWEGEDGPSTRVATSREAVLVGGLRGDATVEHGLSCWLIADVLALAARNAVALAEARLGSR